MIAPDIQLDVIGISFIYMCCQIHTIAIIAEGIPEAQTRKMIKMADEKGITIIGPATVRVIVCI